jgi:hypothetical protein
MAFALVSLVFGFVAYVVTLITQPRGGRISLNAWSEMLFICAVPVTLLAVAWSLTHVGAGADTSLAASLDSLFAQRRTRTLPVLAFIACGFGVPASAHLLILKIFNTRSGGSDA